MIGPISQKTSQSNARVSRGQASIKSPSATTLSLRGQASMEFLTNYAWAVIVLIIGLAVLLYIGVFTPATASLKACNMPAGFTCVDYLIDENGTLNLDIGQAIGKEITINAIACGENESISPTEITPIQISSGRHAPIVGFSTGNIRPCCNESPCIAIVSFNYSYGGANKTVSGEIKGSFEIYVPSTPAPTPSPTPSPTPLPANCYADGNINRCPCELPDSGAYTMDSNLVSNGSCIMMTTFNSNAIVDCEGHSITGNGSDTGVIISGASGASVRNCVISNFSTGISLVSADSNMLNNNTLRNNPNGVVLSGSNGNTISNSTASACETAIRVSTSNNNAIANNTASACGTMIYLSTANSNLITNNTASAYTDYAVSLDTASNNTISNNVANGNTYSTGIYLLSSPQNTISNNTANLNRYGIRLDTSSQNTLSNNSLSGNSWAGIWMSGSDFNTLDSNNATRNSVYGIAVDSSKSNTVSNNIANSNNDSGIYLNSAASNNVTSNTAHYNKNYGVYTTGSTTQTAISGNSLCLNNQTTNDASCSSRQSGENNSCRAQSGCGFVCGSCG